MWWKGIVELVQPLVKLIVQRLWRCVQICDLIHLQVSIHLSCNDVCVLSWREGTIPSLWWSPPGTCVHPMVDIRVSKQKINQWSILHWLASQNSHYHNSYPKNPIVTPWWIFAGHMVQCSPWNNLDSTQGFQPKDVSKVGPTFQSLGACVTQWSSILASYYLWDLGQQTNILFLINVPWPLPGENPSTSQE